MGATFFTRPGEWEELVSIHAPVWVRLPIPPSPPPGKRFQFTHPCGCDSLDSEKPHYGYRFNSRTRVGATSARTLLEAVQAGFNSRTRVGATRLAQMVCDKLNVSIHAPVWVRRVLISGGNPGGCFNSRTRVGATAWLQWDDSQAPVSIHAPVWVRQCSHFRGQPRWMFQFTHPCGCDVYSRVPSPVPRSFNSRTRVGATCMLLILNPSGVVSIHAPVWVRRPDEYGLSIKHATKVLRQPDARTRCGQA